MVLAVASVGTVGFFADRVKGALATQANLLLGADVLISGDRPLPDAFAAEAQRARPRHDAGDPVQQHGARADADARSGRGARRRQGGRAGLSAARRDHARRSRRIPSGRAHDGHSAARRSVARRAARAAARRQGRAIRSRVGEATLKVGAIVQQEPEIASGTASRSVRGCSSTSTTSRRRICCSPAIARRIACSSPIGRRATRSTRYRNWLAARAEGRPADGERARPAPRSAADAGARRAVPRPLGAGRGDPRGGRGRARRIALPAPPSRRRGDAALLRRAARRARSRCSCCSSSRWACSRASRASLLALAGQSCSSRCSAVGRPRRRCRRRRCCPPPRRSAPACCCCSASRCRR